MGKNSFDLIDLRYSQNEVLLSRFFEELYLPAFRDTLEQENPDVWGYLLWEKEVVPPTPILHCFLLGSRLESTSGDLSAGLLFEYYRESSCGLLTYLVVHPSMRGKGIGTCLIGRSFDALKADASSSSEELHAVFGETYRGEGSVQCGDMKTSDRFQFPEKAGARIVDIPYVQPGLLQGQGRSRNMMLLVFGHSGLPIRSIPTLFVKQFLNEFYRALDVTHPMDDRDFKVMWEHLEASGEYLSPVTMPRP